MQVLRGLFGFLLFVYERRRHSLLQLNAFSRSARMHIGAGDRSRQASTMGTAATHGVRCVLRSPQVTLCRTGLPAGKGKLQLGLAGVRRCNCTFRLPCAEGGWFGYYQAYIQRSRVGAAFHSIELYSACLLGAVAGQSAQHGRLVSGSAFAGRVVSCCPAGILTI